MPEQNRPEPIKIRELADEYRRNAERLKIRRHQIAPRHDLHNGERSVHPKVEQEVAEIDERLDEHRADRLLDAVWNHLDMPGKPPEAGVMPSQQGEPAEDLKVGELRCAAVYWMLRRSGHTDPEAPGFVAELNRRRTEFDGASERYKAVAKAELGKSRQLSIEAVDAICQRLIEEGKPANAETVEQAREAVSRKYEHRKRHEISLADLATDAEVEIVPDHLKAAAVVLSHARHDDAGVFDAVDQIVEDADLGRIAIGQNAAERIEDYRRNSAYRWLSAERVESLRDRVLGPPFPALWRSLVVATHEFIGRLTTDDLIGSPVPANVSQEPIRAAAAAVATHASERGWGTTYAAAETLQAQLRAARRILSRRSIERAYCSRDFFGVIAHATDVDIDDITRALALSEAGVIVFSWLAKKAEILSGCDDTELIVLDPLGTDGDPLEDPSDGDFLEASEQLYQLLGLGQSAGSGYEEEHDDDQGSEQEASGVFARRAGMQHSEPGFRLKASMFPGGHAESRM